MTAPVGATVHAGEWDEPGRAPSGAPCRITVDGRETPATAGLSVLDAALAGGAYIPHVCAHSDLRPIGACGMCVVDVDGSGEPVTACTTPVRDGMAVVTRSDRLDAIRRRAMELMLAGHPSECTGCPAFGACEFQSLIQYLGVTDARLRKRPNNIAVDTSNPLITHDMARCVMCGRCVRACGELRGVGVLTYVERDGRVRVGIRDGLTLDEAGCIYCGTCVEVCPTGAIRDAAGSLDPALPRQEALLPCQAACPAGIEIPRYVRLVREGDPSGALAVIREKVPFPAVLGRICNHLCEGACRRGRLGDPLSIRALKRFAAEHGGDSWRARSVRRPATGQSVAVVGAGPTGLTAAFYLAKKGHAVTVFEALPEPGGMLRYGIPAYRLPRSIVDAEIAEITAVGVDLRTGRRVDRPEELLRQGFDAVLLSGGAHRGIRLATPGGELDGVLVGTDFLRHAAAGEPDPVGQAVVVIGGGNVAFDCAGVARELGATTIHVLCLEARAAMLADDEEIAEALAAGTVVLPAHNVDEILGAGGHVSGAAVTGIASFGFDAEGQALLDRIPGTEVTLAADTVIMAVGQQPDVPEDVPVARGRGRRVVADPHTCATNLPGVFAAGDTVTGTRSVIAAIAAGRAAAAGIDAYLGGDGDIAEVLAPRLPLTATIGPKGPGFAGRPRPATAGLGPDEAQAEADRCLQCDRRARIAEQPFWSAYAHR